MANKKSDAAAQGGDAPAASQDQQGAQTPSSGQAEKPPVDEHGLRTDGPTLAEYVKAGYAADIYPPIGYAAKPEPEGDNNPLPKDDKYKTPQPPIPAENLTQAETDVLMVFPRDVKLCLDDNRLIHFRKGVQRVPVHLADHWYLKAHKVQRA